MAQHLYDIWQRETPFDWLAIFGNEQPIDVELGCGTGRFILNMGQRFPGRNFFGIEYKQKWFNIVVKRTTKRELSNVAMAFGDVHPAVEKLIPEDSIENYYIQFPDPWPKKRHHKRRIFQPSFCANLKRGLKPGGCVNIMTDVPEYFAVIVANMDSYAGLVKQPHYPVDPGRVITNYEEKALKIGAHICQVSYRKESD